MTFNSLVFLVFFAIVLSLYWLIRSWRARKGVLLVASYLFYAAWNPPFVVLLWISTIVDWFVARRIASTQDQTRRRSLLLVSLGTNLGLLGYFKYADFFLDNFVVLMAALGVDYQPPQTNIILPVGISFYTFQTLSYTIDIYRGDDRPWPSFLDFALFVTFFPQLVAGPIVRAFDFLPQCEEPPRITRRHFGWGISLFLLGLFEKTIIADVFMAPVVDKVYSPGLEPSFVDAWLGTLAFTAQIFCDFAGYSTCAIGVAMCFGFILPDNFRFPYAAIGFSDFWRRWHISLSQWLRDYLYISLGGNRKGKKRTQFNLFMTMFLGGLWHGAAWTFVIWGCLHGAYLMGERLVRAVVPPLQGARRLIALSLGWLTTYLLVVLAWIFFRAQDFHMAFAVLEGIFGLAEEATSVTSRLDLIKVLGVTAALLGAQLYMRNTTLEEVVERVPWPLRALVLAGMAICIILLSGDDRAFIYFQF